jgi:hypothetical protein
MSKGERLPAVGDIVFEDEKEGIHLDRETRCGTVGDPVC